LPSLEARPRERDDGRHGFLPLTCGVVAGSSNSGETGISSSAARMRCGGDRAGDLPGAVVARFRVGWRGLQAARPAPFGFAFLLFVGRREPQ
jgi:hypothetical protein